jgi:hypothetical protein
LGGVIHNIHNQHCWRREGEGGGVLYDFNHYKYDLEREEEEEEFFNHTTRTT